MESNRNWQGWAALALAGLALLVALVGRNSGPAVTVAVAPLPADPRAGIEVRPFEGGRGWREPSQAMPAEPQGRGEWRGSDNGPGFGPGAGHHRFERGQYGHFAGDHPRHGFPFFMPFMLIGGLIKLAGIALIVWLLMRLFRSRRDRPQPPSSPTAQA